MEFDTIRAKIDGIPHMDAHHGRLIYDHVRKSRPSLILELGSAHGVSAAYICAALEANSHGRLVSIDIDRATYEPWPVKLFETLGLSDRAEFIRVPDSSYCWLLRNQIKEQSDAAGNCVPLYDFVFIDGAHEFTIDGLATVLATKLLKPDGWLLLDDLDWTYSGFEHPPPFHMSQSQMDVANVREVFECIVRGDPSYTEFRIEDEHWAWAHKGNGPRKLDLVVSEPLSAVATRKARSVVREIRRRRANPR